ncbi:MAG: secondary thiamine-phosphate synthase enzyme YjbQ [Candidatus Hodarchaeota archaeon]
MKYHTSTIPVKTRRREELIDITNLVRTEVKTSGVQQGTCIVFSKHTTCGVTINENADPDVKADIITQLKRIFPEDENYRHLEGNSDAHLKTSFVGPSETIIVENGRLSLGTWQGIMLCEFDGPRSRTVLVRIQGD